ncbi:MFS transporter [Paraburkholderia sp. J12]|uniref:MFS transporter n=1 Tax=Paraburkholderia sp. J12 TaxID=2805432 RepID=UPI002ABDDE2A|nr:MFS transporter [Paraburkholderia sp. J12]
MFSGQQLDMVRPAQRPRELRKVLFSCFLGSTVEYYDLLLYYAAAALILGKIFFSGLSPAEASLAAMATLTLGYLGRPIGGVFFGHFGDKYGRKKVLVVTLATMGAATGLIGCIPEPAHIGIWAPVTLIFLRVVQGFSAGGEWGGAALMAYEHAPKKHRVFAASFSSAGAPAGTMVATGVLGACALMPTPQFESWGWRIPFLMSFLLIGLGLWVRLSVHESPLFLMERERQEKSKTEVKTPLVEILKHPRNLILSTIALASFLTYSTLSNAIGLSYAHSLNISVSTILSIQSVSALSSMIAQLVSGSLSDRIGYRKVMGFGLILGALFAYPFMLLIGTGNTTCILVAYLIMYIFVLSPLNGPAPGYLAQLFQTGSRYTGSSLGFQLGTMIGAGLAPIALASMMHLTGNGVLYVSTIVAVFGLAGFICFVVSSRPGVTEAVSVQMDSDLEAFSARNSSSVPSDSASTFGSETTERSPRPSAST